MLAFLQDPDALIDLRPLRIIRRRLHREFRARRVARLRHVIRRGDLLDIHRMSKSRRAQPVAGFAERVFGAARRAVLLVAALDLSDLESSGEAAGAAFAIEALRLPRLKAFVCHHGINRAGGVAFSRNPDLFARSVLRERDRQSLRRRKAHDGAEPRRPGLVEHMESRYIGWEGVAGQHAAIKQAVEQLAAVAAFGAGFSSSFFGRVLAARRLPRRLSGLVRLLSGRARIAASMALMQSSFISASSAARSSGESSLGIQEATRFLRRFLVLGEPGLEIVRYSARPCSDRNPETVPSTENKSCGCVGVDIGQSVLMIVLKQERTDVTAGDFAIVERELRVDHVAADHAVRLGEIVLVVAVGAAERDHGRNGVAAASGAARALLIICASRRHIAQRHAGQSANIDTDFHRRGAGEHVDGRRAPRLACLRRARHPETATRVSSALEKTSSFCGALSCAVCSAAMRAIGSCGGSASAAITGRR